MRHRREYRPGEIAEPDSRIRGGGHIDAMQGTLLSKSWKERLGRGARSTSVAAANSSPLAGRGAVNAYKRLPTDLGTNAAIEEHINCYCKTGESFISHDQYDSLTACRRETPEMAACVWAIQRTTFERFPRVASRGATR